MRARRIAALVVGALLMSTHARGADFSAQLDRRWDYAKPEVSETRFREALRQYPAGSREALEIATQVARAQGLQRKFDAAHATLDKIEVELVRVDARVRIRASRAWQAVQFLGIARQGSAAVPQVAEVATRQDGRVTRSTRSTRCTCWASPLPSRSGSTGTCAHSRWPSARRMRAPAAGARRSTTTSAGRYSDRGEHASALGYWEKSLAVREASGDQQRTRIARWTVARGYRALGRLDDAERMQRDLAEDNRAAGEEDGYVYEELAELRIARGDAAGAAPGAAKAYALLREDAWLAATEPARLERLAKIGAGEVPAPPPPKSR